MSTPPPKDWERALRQAPEVPLPPTLAQEVQERVRNFRIRSRRTLRCWAWAYFFALVAGGLPWLLLTWLVFPPAARAWVRRLVLWQWALPMLWDLLREGLGRAWWAPVLALALLTFLGLFLWTRWLARLWARRRWPETLQAPQHSS